MVEACLANGFLIGSVTTVALFILILLIVVLYRRWRYGTLGSVTGVSAQSQGDYRRVEAQEGNEMSAMSTSARSGAASWGVSVPASGSSSFTIDSDEEEEPADMRVVGGSAHVTLEDDPAVTPHEFESFWLSFQARDNQDFQLDVANVKIEEVLGERHIKCMASGAIGQRQKYYFFARDEQTHALLLLEVFVLERQREMSVEVRCADPILLKKFMVYLSMALRPVLQ